MKYLIYFILLLLIGFNDSSCIPNSDYTENLSGEYFFRGEGEGTNDILPYSANEKEIPANVLAYEYDNDFITAKQKPNNSDDPLYENKPIYPQGRNHIYYWIIIHSDKSIIGPLTKKEFELEFKKYNIPENLKLD